MSLWHFDGSSMNNEQNRGELYMKYKHTNRPGFLLGFIDFFTAGLFFLFYMPHGLQDELEEILGHRVMPYWKAYLLGIPSLFM